MSSQYGRQRACQTQYHGGPLQAVKNHSSAVNQERRHRMLPHNMRYTRHDRPRPESEKRRTCQRNCGCHHHIPGKNERLKAGRPTRVCRQPIAAILGIKPHRQTRHKKHHRSQQMDHRRRESDLEGRSHCFTKIRTGRHTLWAKAQLSTNFGATLPLAPLRMLRWVCNSASDTQRKIPHPSSLENLACCPTCKAMSVATKHAYFYGQNVHESYMKLLGSLLRSMTFRLLLLRTLVATAGGDPLRLRRCTYGDRGMDVHSQQK